MSHPHGRDTFEGKQNKPKIIVSKIKINPRENMHTMKPWNTVERK